LIDIDAALDAVIASETKQSKFGEMACLAGFPPHDDGENA
jgi:hypothetical protein